MMIQLTLTADGDPIFIAPDHVLSVHASDDPICSVVNMRDNTGWKVQGTPHEVVAALHPSIKLDPQYKKAILLQAQQEDGWSRTDHLLANSQESDT